MRRPASSTSQAEPPPVSDPDGAVLTSGVFGPLVLHQTQKRRDSLTDQRAALHAAIGPLAKARAQISWLQVSGFDRDVDLAERDRRFEDLLHQTQLLEAHLVKLQIRLASRSRERTERPVGR
jgi:hypothetical protein